jgi:predicted Rossmann-fold nucleotide-binding protein
VSDCFVAFYGGIGTVLEILTVLQLMQVKKIEGRKLILVGDMWPGLIEWFKTEMLKEDMQLIHQGDLMIPQLVSHYHGALELIQQHKLELGL